MRRVLVTSLLDLLLAAGLASAAPITLGSWLGVTAPDQASAFWSGTSWDCPTCGIGYVLAGETASDFSRLEYLTDGFGGPAGFVWDHTPDWSLVSAQTAWTAGQLTIDGGGDFRYDSATGRRSDSLGSGGQYALFRLVGATDVRYYLGVEDILLSEVRNDRDYNDHVVTWTESEPVPEPGTLLLLGAGLTLLRCRSRRPAAGSKARGAVQCLNPGH
jgi:hypothetical protein